jgi:hypothetical protein
MSVNTHTETRILGFIVEDDYCGNIVAATVITDSQLPGRGTDHAAEVAKEIASLIEGGWTAEDLTVEPGDSFVY